MNEKPAQPTRSHYYPLFKHMSDNHQMTLLDSELEEICRAVDRVRANREEEGLKAELAQAKAENARRAPDYGHLQDYALDLHIITGPNGMCRCGEDGITCGQRLSAVSCEIQSAIIGATMARKARET